MAIVVIYDPGHADERVLNKLGSVNTPDYEGRVGTDVVIYANKAAMPTLLEAQRYWRHDTGVIRDMDAGEKAAFDAEIDAALLAANRAGSKAVIDVSNVEGFKIRAIVELMIREVNILRAQHTLPDRTLAQAKQAYLDLIDEGAVDG